MTSKSYMEGVYYMDPMYVVLLLALFFTNKHVLHELHFFYFVCYVSE